MHAQAAVIEIIVGDKESQEALIGANVFNIKSNEGGVSNLDGKVVFNLPRGSYDFSISYLGYTSDTIQLDLSIDTVIHVLLEESFDVLETVEVIGTQNIRDRGVVSISQEIIDKIPTVFGEREVVRALQLLPGVQSGSEGSSSIFVRGGSSDQNLVALNGAPLFNLSHLFGMFSVFNSSIVQ